MPDPANFGSLLPRHHLLIQPPTAPHESPSIVDMERMREIPLDWVEIMDKSKSINQFVGVNDDLLGIRQYLEHRWTSIGFDPSQQYEVFRKKFEEPAPADPAAPEAPEGGPPAPVGAAPPPEPDAPVIEESNPLFRYGTVALNNPDLPEGTEKEERTGFYFVHPSGRLYMPTVSENTLTPIDIKAIKSQVTDYESFWVFLENNAIGLEPVWTGKTQSEIEVQLSDRRYVSREAHLWSKLYFQLKKRIQIGDTITKVSDGKLKADDVHFASVIEDEFNGNSRNGERLDDFLKVQTRFNDIAAKARSDMNMLRSRIIAAGYTLAEKSQEVTHPYTKKPTTVNEGQIYKTSHQIVRWSTPYTVWKTKTRRGSCGKRKTFRYPVTQYKAHAVPYTHWELVDLNNDPVRSYIEALTASGKTVHVMQATDDGFVSATGERLENLMVLTDLSEEIRLNTVIVFPDYTPVVSDIENFNGATFFTAPLPGIYPEQFPIVSIHEDIGYKLQWTGTELGQLVGSLNLAPGEEREIAVSARFEEEVSETDSFKSTFTTERTASSEMATEISNEASREFTKTKQSSKSASLGGSYGPVSGKASAKSSSSSTLKLFSRSMKKVARKASSSVSQKKNIEITSRFAKTTRIEQESSRTTVVKNINSGSTLNLLFHQINNVFVGGLYLNDFRIAITSGREVIAGSDIFETKVFQLSDLDDALEALAPEQLPPIMRRFIDADDTDEDQRGKMIERRTGRYWFHLLKELVDILQQEYFAQTEAFDQVATGIENPTVTPVALRKSVDLVMCRDGGQTLNSVFATKNGALDANVSKPSDIGQAYENLKAVLQGVKILEQPLDETRLIVASAGVWMDSATGQGAALDEYSTQMRDIERSKSIAELEALNEENAFERSKRQKLLGDVPKNARLIVVLAMTMDDDWVRLSLSDSVKHSSWRVFIGGSEVVPAEMRLDETTGNLALRLGEGHQKLAPIKSLTLVSNTSDGLIIAL